MRFASVLFALLSLVAVDAAAFTSGTTYGLSANNGGGSKMYFTGSQRFRGYDCTMCHVDAPGEMTLAIESDPPELLTEGVYKPWQIYTISVEMLGAGEHDNMFVAEMVDDALEPAGSFDEVELATLQRAVGEVTIDGTIIAASNLSKWELTYEAPGPGAGRLSFHIGAVAGDGGQSRAEPRPPTDPLGDDVYIARRRLCEEFVSCDRSFDDVIASDLDSPAGHGCNVGPVAPTSPGRAWLWLALPLLLLRLRRPTRRRSTQPARSPRCSRLR